MILKLDIEFEDEQAEEFLREVYPDLLHLIAVLDPDSVLVLDSTDKHGKVRVYWV